jgi:hypothetical protein
MNYETRITRMTTVPQGEELFSEQATEIEIVNEAGGEFVVIQQHYEEYGKIAINPEEWIVLREAIDKMIKECRKEK